MLAEYVLEEHELALLREACRTADLLDQLDTVARQYGPLGADGKAHSAVVEARQQRICLARVLAALRLPAGDEGDQQKGARRPQRRSVRGVYGMIA